MTVLCTFPGKFGDLLWALPTVRAISRRVGHPVDLAVAGPSASICPLLTAQPYIGVCLSIPSWVDEVGSPWNPRVPRDVAHFDGYDGVLHLGYRGWPDPDCVRHTLETANREGVPEVCGGGMLTEAELTLDEPWITRREFRGYPPPEISVGWSAEHAELKAGVTGAALLNSRMALGYHADILLWERLREFVWLDLLPELCVFRSDWDTAVRTISTSRVFLGCCSALHVLAAALGVPVVLMEPQPARHHPAFYPLGDRGPRVTLVRGTDGLPTFDARHVADALQSVLAR